MRKKDQWFNAKLQDIDADEVEQIHKESVRTYQKLVKEFDNVNNVKSILSQWHVYITALDEWKPTVNALCNKALQPRHWSKIKEVTGMSSEQD